MNEPARKLENNDGALAFCLAGRPPQFITRRAAQSFDAAGRPTSYIAARVLYDAAGPAVFDVTENWLIERGTSRSRLLF
jgi:hypothetical protein